MESVIKNWNVFGSPAFRDAAYGFENLVCGTYEVDEVEAWTSDKMLQKPEPMIGLGTSQDEVPDIMEATLNA